jgi:hypothetical protein
VSAAWATRGGADGKEDIDIPTGNNNDANADIPAMCLFLFYEMLDEVPHFSILFKWVAVIRLIAL